MIKVSSSEFDRLVANFRENMSCRLFLDGLPIYQLEPSLWAMPVGVKHVVDKKTKFEFNPAVKGPELNEYLLRRVRASKPEGYSVVERRALSAFLNNMPVGPELAAYFDVAKTILGQKLFLAAFSVSFFLVYEIAAHFG
jgi:hypothetical protein